MPVLIARAIEPKSLRKRVSWAWVRGGDCKVWTLGCLVLTIMSKQRDFGSSPFMYL